MSQQSTRSKLYNWAVFIVITLVVIFVNIIGSFVYQRIDVTEDERYSLAKGTIEFLEKMNPENAKSEDDKEGGVNRLYIKIYLEGEMPAEIRRFRNAVEDKLIEFREIAGDRIEYEFISPKKDNEADQKEMNIKLYSNGKGIIPMDVEYGENSEDATLWPGAEIIYNGVTKGYIQLLPGTPQGTQIKITPEFSEVTIQNSINNLEYSLVSGLRKVIQKRRPRIAFIQGHGELREAETQIARSLLKDNYTVEDIYLNDSLDALKDVDGVIIARPKTAYSGKDLYLIDQFLMKGGRLMVFMDQLTFPGDTLAMKGTVHTTRTQLGIDQLLFDYGIKINDNYVRDINCGIIPVPFSQSGHQPWFYYVQATSTRSPISRNIDPVMLRYASSLTLVPNNSYLVTPVLTSSANSGATGMAPLISLGEPLNYGRNPVLSQNGISEGNKLCLAAVSEGMFQSHFRDRLSSSFADNKASGMLDSSKVEGKVMVVGNGSFIANYYDSILGKNGETLYRPKFNNLRYDEVYAFLLKQKVFYGNQEFFQNMVDYMLGENSVLDIRSKQIDLHPIDKEKVKEKGGTYQVLNMILPSSLVILFAIALFYLRKRRYGRS
jgi:gliding-associated putative ABC transporter substrate-binding component GldG